MCMTHNDISINENEINHSTQYLATETLQKFSIQYRQIELQILNLANTEGNIRPSKMIF